MRPEQRIALRDQNLRADQIDSGDRVVVGVNRYRLDAEEPYQPLRVDPAIEDNAVQRLAMLRSSRSSVPLMARDPPGSGFAVFAQLGCPVMWRIP